MDADGTFLVVTSLDAKNTVTLAGDLTINNTGDGFVYVLGDTAHALTVADGATVYISGAFTALNAGDSDNSAATAVILTGDTSLAGNSAVCSDATLLIPESKKLTISSGALTLGGTATVNGAVNGKVTGNGGKLYVANTAGTDVDADGTFLAVTSLDAKNTVTLAGALTVSGTETGAVYVLGNTNDGLTVAEGAAAYIRGVFASVTGKVILTGDTTINGGGSAVVAATAEKTICALDVGGSSNVTVKAGTYSSLVVDGGTLTIEPVLTVKDVQVINGSLVMAAATGKLTTEKIIVGSVKTELKTGSASYITGTLCVDKDTIKQFPTPVSSGTYMGWVVSGKDDVVSGSVSGYALVDQETLVIKWVFQSFGGGGSFGYAIDVTKSLTGGDEYSGTSAQLGTVAVSNDASSGSKVTITVSAGASFRVDTVAVTDNNKKSVDLTNNGDGTYTFVMPSSNVSISVGYIPVLSDTQVTPPVKKAVKSPQKIYYNGELISIMAYNVNGNNYVKLRDIANLLNGSSRQFSIDYSDGHIKLTSGQAYVPVGGENTMTADQSATCVVSRWSVETNGVVRYLKCYNIAGNNYFQLRELSELFDFGISYDQATNSVYITTK